MKIEVNYIFREEMIDPIYEQIGLETEAQDVEIAVSYTHLTLPTKRIV